MSGLGYRDKELTDVLKMQIDKLMHTSNLYYNTTCGKAAEALKDACGMDRVFFTNSGTEANEGVLKVSQEICVEERYRAIRIYCYDSFLSWKKYGSSVGDRA